MQENPKEQNVQTNHPLHFHDPATKPKHGWFVFSAKFVMIYIQALGAWISYKAGVSKLRHSDQKRPAKSFHPAREGILSMIKKIIH